MTCWKIRRERDPVLIDLLELNLKSTKKIWTETEIREYIKAVKMYGCMSQTSRFQLILGNKTRKEIQTIRRDLIDIING